jgi:chemotaxis-related protein WspB
MLFLLFAMGPDRFVLDVRQIAEVLPLVEMKQLPQAAHGVAGIVNYRGAPVPVVDLSALTLGRPAARRLSTRIVLVHYPDAQGVTHLLGLITEKATQTIRRAAVDFVASGVSSDGAPYLGPVAPDARGLLQWIDVRTLLPAAVRDVLFRQVVER